MRQPFRISPLAFLLCLPLLVTSSGGAAAQQVRAAEQLQVLLDELAQGGDDDGAGGLTLEAAEKRSDRARELLDRLEPIDREGLAHDQQVVLDVLGWSRAGMDEVELYWYSSPLMPALSPLRGALGRAGSFELNDEEGTQAYLDFVRGVDDSLTEVFQKERGRAARGIILPDEQIDRVVPFLASFAVAGPDNPLWVDEARLAGLSGEAADAFGNRLRSVLERRVARTADRLMAYVDQSLRARAPNTVGMSQYPGGRRAYRTATRLLTTLEITPEEVHEIGLAAVEDINRQMAEVRERIGFEGTKAEFHEQLRRDPRFYVERPEQFGERLMEYDARIQPHIDDYFLRRPEAPYSVRRVNLALEASLTYGFYNLPTETDANGYYNYNGSKLSERSLLSGAALAFHELVPGHHFQIMLQAENESLPLLRRRQMFAGYTEGWGEYSSSVVAREMGMYEDPYDLYGRLVFDNFFAVRLVVDTGMNYYGWSRPKAMLYMREHTMESDVQIDSETIRYSMRSPAQALAYRMGRETFLRLRRHAEAALGDHFDVRRFHDAVLSIGSVPLVVLESHVEWWIEQELAG